MAEYYKLDTFAKMCGGPDENEADAFGMGCFAQPFECRDVKLDFTAPMGTATGVYYGLVFQFGKWDYRVIKLDEYIDVSPVHEAIYRQSIGQKEALEGRIKAGLTSAAQAVADFELLKHDLRKYKEFISYVDDKDEHPLKAIFVDQVDFHAGSTGQGAGRLSMSFMQQANIMPTIVHDFMRMKKLEDLDTDPYLANIPAVEKNMLRTKWRTYEEWKRLFGTEVNGRYERVLQLVRSRRKSIDEYRQWLKPYIARHKLIAEGLGNEGYRKGDVTKPIRSAGEALSENSVTLMAWYYMDIEEFNKAPGELAAKEQIPTYDPFIKRNFIFDLAKDYPKLAATLRASGERSLKERYPWITEDWVKRILDEIEKPLIWEGDHLYFSAYQIRVDKMWMHFPAMADFEDFTFVMNGMLMSKNLLFVRLLEAKAKEQEFEHYVDNLLGLYSQKAILKYKRENNKLKITRHENADPETMDIIEQNKEFDNLEDMKKRYPDYVIEEDKEERNLNILKPISDAFDFLGIKLKFFKKGQYERDFQERVPNIFQPMVGRRFGMIRNFLQGGFSVGN